MEPTTNTAETRYDVLAAEECGASSGDTVTLAVGRSDAARRLTTGDHDHATDHRPQPRQPVAGEEDSAAGRLRTRGTDTRARGGLRARRRTMETTQAKWRVYRCAAAGSFGGRWFPCSPWTNEDEARALCARLEDAERAVQYNRDSFVALARGEEARYGVPM